MLVLVSFADNLCKQIGPSSGYVSSALGLDP